MSSLVDELVRRARSGQLVASMEPDATPAVTYPPVGSLRVWWAEAQLGFKLPPLLREFYTKVANGGFGPGYGLIGIHGGAPTFGAGRSWTLVDVYRSTLRSNQRGQPWRPQQLVICHWGCDYYSYLDCILPQAPVMAVDLNSHGHGPWDCAFSLHAKSFEEWMQRWIDGEDMWNSIGLCGAPKLGFEEYGPQT